MDLPWPNNLIDGDGQASRFWSPHLLKGEVDDMLNLAGGVIAWYFGPGSTVEKPFHWGQGMSTSTVTDRLPPMHPGLASLLSKSGTSTPLRVSNGLTHG